MRVAFACRYGHQSLSEAMDCEDLDAFNGAIGKFIEEEGRANKTSGMATGG